MLKHYIKIAFRNVFKYKAQTLISVCAISVSIMLFVMVTSLMMRIRPLQIFEMSYIDRVVCIKSSPNIFDNDELELIKTHNFKSAETVIPNGGGYLVSLATTYQYNGSPRSKLIEGQTLDGRLLNFLGYTSDVTGELLPVISGDSTIISRRMAEKLFGSSKSAMGQKIFIDIENQKKSYYIKNVIADPYINDNTIRNIDVYLSGKRGNGFYCANINALLRNGFTKDDLKKEIDNLLPDNQLKIEYQKDMEKGDTIIFRIRNGIIIFLFLFLMVSLISFLRQKVQLFRIRQREIALRTVLGGKEIQMFVLFFIEVAIILTVSTIISLILSYFIKHIFTTEYYPFLSELNWNISNIFPTTMIIYAIMMVISASAVALCVHRIKRDQTGLALQMKPRPKHHMRNVGLTIQLTISMVFTWITILAYNTSFFMDKSMKIPENDADYKDGIALMLNFVEPVVGDKVYNMLKMSDAIDKVYSEQLKFEQMIMYDDNDGEYRDFMKVYTQTSDEITDFFKIDISVTNPNANPAQNVAVSKRLKETLEKAGKWSEGSLTINNITYEISGLYDQIPYDITDRPSAIVTDVNYTPLHSTFYILPKHGRNKDAMKDIEKVIEQELPERIDISPERLSTRLSPYSSLRDVLRFVICLLTVVSIVTTLASLYSSVTLDTRRRRKEMALRKINGAKTTDICRIFAKKYIVLVLVSATITFLLCRISTILWMQDLGYFPHPIQDFFIAVIAVSFIIFITIAWKIRDIMKVAPGEYLKD